jgi:hypothetical protein
MVTGTWIPSATLLGTHGELVNFSHSIQFYVPGAAADPTATPPVEAGVDVYYKIRITALDSNQSTVNCTYPTPLDPAIISGYYKGIFNDTLTTRAKDGTFTTITTLGSGGGVFDTINRDKVYEVISFKADTVRSKTFTYLAEAIDTLVGSPTYNQVVASQNYTIKAEDKNWTPGLNNLRELVSYASSKSKR